MSASLRRKLAWTALAASALAAAALAPNTYWLFVLGMAGITCIAAVGLNVLTGLTGQVSLGHAGFFAIGAYVNAILATKAGVAFWWTLPAAALASGALGFVLAAPALRVRGPYLAMLTIAFGVIVENAIAEGEPLTGGFNGIQNVPRPSLFGVEFGMRSHVVLIVVLAIAAVIVFARLAGSRAGAAMRATRDSEIAAAAIGINPLWPRASAFACAAAGAGIAGALYAPLSGFVSPENFSFYQSILFLLVVILGGAGSVAGPVVGAAVMTALPEALAGFAEYRLLFFGALLLVVLWVAPEGIVGAWNRRFGARKSDPVEGDAARAAAFIRAGARPEPLVVRGLGIDFGGGVGVAQAGFEAEAGRIHAVIGPNGAGKTTLLNLIGGFYRTDSGSVEVRGAELSRLPSHRLARLGLARTFQATQLFNSLSVEQNILLALETARRRGAGPASGDLRRAGPALVDIRRTARDLLAFVGYRGDANIAAADLPFVDRRWVELARTLALQPETILLDEPAAGLAHQDVVQVSRLIRRVAESGLKVVLVEHHMELVMELSARILVLDAGRPLAIGTPAEIQVNPAVIAAYLGSDAAKVGGAAPRPSRAARPATADFLSVRGVVSGYGKVEVLHGVDLDVGAGELVALVGANGAGKSTLLRTLAGLVAARAGEVRFDGAALRGAPPDAIVRAGLVMVPEGRQVFPELSVIDNLRLGAYLRRDAEVQADVDALLLRFPVLSERSAQRAGLLSGGEQQMLALARGLIARPKLLLLDEPSLGLAPKRVDELYQIVTQLRDEGKTLLLVDQFARLALALADRAYVMATGRIVKHGQAAELLADPAVEAAYLGKA